MYKKILYLFLVSIIAVSLLSGCSSSMQGDRMPESTDSTEITADTTVDESSAENTESAEKPENTDSSEMQNENLIRKNVLYREDFDIPDCRNLGYTNMIDFYNDYPDGKSGGTFANAGLMVHYPGDLDADLSDADSLSFTTYRGIGLGSGLDEVFDAYGTVTVSPPNEWETGISSAEHTLKSSVIYSGQIKSGAYVTLRFYFDQNDTVMFISYDAIYARYASGTQYPEAFEIVND